MNYILLKDIHIESQSPVINVRAVRFNDVMSATDPKKRTRLEMVLVDAEGNLIEAWVPEYWHKCSQVKLKEDNIYIVKNFQIIGPKRSYRTVDHDCMLQFTPITTIQLPSSYPANFPLYGHCAVTFDVLRGRINNINVTSDVIVILTGCGHARDQGTKNTGIKRLRNLTVTDGIETASVALWGKHADNFDPESCMQSNVQKPVVVLFCAMTCGTFNNNLSLRGSAACRWYINPDIPEAHTLRTSYGAQVPALAWLDAPQPAPEIQSQTVAELASLQNRSLLENKQIKLSAKIIGIETDQAWWYLACNKCYRGMRDSDGVFRCSDYSCPSTEGTPRYRLTVRVRDPETSQQDKDAPIILLVFFGAVAEEIVGAPVHEILAGGEHHTNSLPKKIENLLGKILIGRVAANRHSFTTLQLSLQVKKILSVVSADSVGQGTSATVVSQVLENTRKETDHGSASDPQQTVHAGKSDTRNKPQELASHILTSSSLHEQPKTNVQAVQQELLQDAATTVTGDENSGIEVTTASETEAVTPPATGMKRQRVAKEDTTPATYKRADTGAKKKLVFEDPANQK